MYKAIHAQTGEEIIILQPGWLKRIADLRALDQADLLVCQGCGQPLRVKAGEVKRPHFAHKHLQACSYGTESPAILAARAVLYEWLVQQFGEAATLEKALPGLPRPVDGWVETARGSFSYWMIEAGIKLEAREAMLAAFEPLGAGAHFVFLASMLREEKKEFHSLLLTPTERAFLRPSAYDAMQSAPGEMTGSLHYLDAEQETLTTFRALSLHHRPNWFRGLKKSTPLRYVKAGRADGAFIHPGEAARLSTYIEKRDRLARKRQEYEERTLQEQRAQWTQQEQGVDEPPPQAMREEEPQVAPSLARPPESDSSAEKRPAWGETPLPCATCGQLTTDYWATFYDERGRLLCRCRECLGKES